MLQIAVCDNDKKGLGLIRESWKELLPEEEEPVFTYYETGRELLEKIRNDLFQQDLLYIDSQLSDIDGFVVIEILRRHRIPANVILVSKDNDAARKGYRYRVYDYLRKPFQTEEVRRVADRYIREFLRKEDRIKTVRVRGKEKKLVLDDILYFESHVRVVKAVMEDDSLDFYMKMNDLADELQEKGFFRCHQSFLINLDCVYRIENNNSVLLFNRRQIPVSRRYIHQLKQIMAERNIDF